MRNAIFSVKFGLCPLPGSSMHPPKSGNQEKSGLNSKFTVLIESIFPYYWKQYSCISVALNKRVADVYGAECRYTPCIPIMAE